jgi:hypothetical protein
MIQPYHYVLVRSRSPFSGPTKVHISLANQTKNRTNLPINLFYFEKKNSIWLKNEEKDCLNALKIKKNKYTIAID